MLAALVLSACSARQGYEFNRSQGEQNARCDEKRTASEEAACRAAYERSFEDYQRELEALQDREDPP